MADILPTKCIECESLLPLCKKCENHLLKYDEELGSLNRILDFYFLDIFFVTSKLECKECQDKFYLAFDNIQYSCLSCPSNCEFCTTIMCARCEDNYVLSFYEGKCYPISQFKNITEEYQNSCSKIVSENPWAQYFLGSSLFLCQKCRNSSYYPSMNGNCMKCIDPKCDICIEASDFLGFSTTFIYTNALYQSPFLLLGWIKEVTSLSTIQRCLSCSAENAYEPSHQVCCAPSSEIMTPTGIKTFMSGCQSCSYCNFIDSQNSRCGKCLKCENVAENLLNDENYVKSVNHSSPFFAKKIYYQLMTEGQTFNTTPSLNETETFKNIYNSLTFQKQVDFDGASINKFTPCPINTIDCMVPPLILLPLNTDTFKIGDIVFYDLMSYLLVSTKCRDNFVFDYGYYSSRCKFCPKKWKNCKAYKILEIKFIGPSKLINETSMVNNIKDLIILFENIEKSEFTFICNEFSVKEIIIHIILDIDEIIIWQNIDSYSMVLESSLKSRIPSLEKYELIFIPKYYEANTFATINVGCYIDFKGYTSVKFMNIIFKPFVTNPDLVSDIKLTPSIVINAGSIFLTGCSLMYDQMNYGYNRILEDVMTVLINLLSFSLNADLVNLDNFKIKNLKLKNYDALNLLNAYRFFEIKGQKVSLKNITFEKLIIYNIFSVFYFPTLEGSSQTLENIEILNCELIESIFFRLGGSLSLNFNHLYIYNTAFLEKPIITSLLEIITSISFKNILIEKCIFHGSTEVNYVFSLNLFNDVNNVVIKDNYFDKTIIFFCIEKTIIETTNFYFKNIFFLRNVLENFEERFPFLMSFEFSASLVLNINLEQISLQNNLMVLPRKINIYAFIFNNLDSIAFEMCSFFNNMNVSAIYMESINSVQFNQFTIAKNNSIIDQTQDQILFYMLNIKNLITFENLNVDSMFSQQGIIIVSQVINYQTNICQILFKKSILNNILIHSQNLASAILISSLTTIEVNIFQSTFSNLILNDESQFQRSSAALYIDSSFSSCEIERSLFINGFSNGESTFIKIFIQNFTISETNFTKSNYFDKFNFVTSINSQGSFINALIINLLIKSSSFSKAYSLNGGGIYCNLLNKGATIEINNCTFENLHSLSEAGALFIIKNNEKSLNVSIINCTFKHISALVNGGSILIKALSNSQIFINNSFF